MGPKHCTSLAGLLEEQEKKNVKRKTKKMKRGKGSKNLMLLNVFSTNSAGLKSKLLNCKSAIRYFEAAIFTIQETHFEKKESLKWKVTKSLRLLEIRKMVGP